MNESKPESPGGRRPGVATAKSAHAPAPWEVRPYSKIIFIVQPHQFIKSGVYVAEVSLQAAQADGSPPDPKERMANARLIAAAPELLEALKCSREELLSFLAWSVNPNEYKTTAEWSAAIYKKVEYIDAAIAKAEGLS